MRFHRWLLIVSIFFTALVGFRGQARAQNDIPTLSYGDSAKGTIDNTEKGRGAIYLFDGTKDDVITITMKRTSGNLNPLISFGYLDANNKAKVLKNSPKTTNGTATVASFTLPATRTYYILATRDGLEKGTTTGKFTLTLDSDQAAQSGGGEDSACIGVEDPTDVTVPEDGNQQQWKEPDQVLEDGKTYCAILTTKKGRIVMELYADSAPQNVNNFVFLAQNGFYDNITWHRVIPGFVAQTGDPTGTGTGGPGYTVPLEIDPKVKYDRAGRVGVARANDPDSAGSQFFITYGPLPSLNPHSKELPDSDGYTIIGQVVEGMDVAKKLKAFEADKTPSGKGDALVSVRVVALDKK